MEIFMKIIFSFILVGIIYGFSACGPSENWQNESSLGDIEEDTREISREDTKETIETSETEATREESSIETSSSEELSKEEISDVNLDGNYYYDLLSNDEKKVYNQIYLSAVNFKEELDLSEYNLDEKTFCKIWASFNYDNPGLFWANNLSFNSFNDVIMDMGFYVNDTAKENSERLNKEVENIVKNIPEGDTYEKAKYLYDYLIDNTEYQEEDYVDTTPDSVLLNKETSSVGLAKTFKLLCDNSDIKCVFVKASKGETHFGINLINIDDNWYWIDLTSGKLLENRDNYFCISDNELNKLCIVDTGIEVVMDKFENIFTYPTCPNSFNK